MPDGLRNWLTLVAATALMLATAFLAASPAGASVEVYEEQNEVAQQIQEQLGPARSFALVIGISEFDNWNGLSGVKNEVDDVMRTLRWHDFEIDEESRHGRVTADELHRAISEFLRRRGDDPANRLVIYIATHGARETRRDGGYGFLVASDSEAPDSPAFGASAYSVKQLSLDIEGKNAQHIFFFFNACFSGAMIPETRGGGQDDPAVPRIDASALSPEVADWTLALLAHNARLVITAGNDDQLVPDKNNPFSRAFSDGLAGAADGDGDGLILGTELAQYMRSRVARETRQAGAANDPVFAILPKNRAPETLRADIPASMKIDYALHGDFVFLSPRGAGGEALAATEDTILKQRRSQMLPGRFVDCSDCPVMVELPKSEKTDAFALARTETTFAEWDACFHDLACRHYVEDGGLGRGDRPVSGMTWLDQRDFIAWLNRRNKHKDSPCEEYRLPSAAEWKFAALAGSETRFSWGDEMLPAHAVCLGCDEAFRGSSALRTAAFSANRLGLYDMTGNVWEWVDDRDCPDDEFGKNGTCANPGTVMGGAYSTSVNAISALAEGKLPRTGNETSTMYSLPTVGFRAACTLKAQ